MDGAREHWQRVKEILEAILERPASERARLLDERCGDDEELRREVESLIAAHDDAAKQGDFFGAEDAPGTVGRYRVVRPIAKGGMGVVYLAEQLEPIKRQVALKLIQVGMDTEEVVARFKLERQALALMNHPNIAQVHDAGATEGGRPYFVMEYVPGDPITRYCDDHRLGLRERLELFIDVCDGIQHAHQKGIIHRDIKPSNVLVMRTEARLVPKVIDFGIAKATAPNLIGKAAPTALGSIVGTPEYISPEQASRGEIGVDTRTDVYSLGVLLYELMTGQLPFGRSTDPGTPLDEILRRIQTDDPARPSSRLSGSAATHEVARARRVDSKSLVRTLRGDLDWIILKALEKDPARRYASAAELAIDVRRHLNDEPVAARPPSVGYRTAKFVRRHRFVAAIGALLALVLVAFSGTLWVKNRTIAEERDRAQIEADTARAVTDFVVGLFDFADPSARDGEAITPELLISSGIDETEKLSDQPIVQARLQRVLADVSQRLSDYERAYELIQQATSTHERLLDPDDPELAYTLATAANVHNARSQWDEAVPLARRAIEILDKRFGEQAPAVAVALVPYAEALREMERFDEAGEAMERRIAILEEDGNASPSDVAAGLISLGTLYLERRDPRKAESLARQAVELLERTLPENHPDLQRPVAALANAIASQRRFADALPLARRALELSERHYGAGSNSTAFAHYNLAPMYFAEGLTDEALDHLRQAESIWAKLLGPDNENAAWVERMRGRIFLGLNDLESAERALREAVRLDRKIKGDEHTLTLRSQERLARVWVLQGRLDDARPLFRADLGRKRRMASGTEASAQAKAEYAHFLLNVPLEDLKDPETALHFAKEANRISEHPGAFVLSVLAEARFTMGDLVGAVDAQEKAVAALSGEPEQVKTQYSARLETFRTAAAGGTD